MLASGNSTVGGCLLRPRRRSRRNAALAVLPLTANAHIRKDDSVCFARWRTTRHGSGGWRATWQASAWPNCNASQHTPSSRSVTAATAAQPSAATAAVSTLPGDGDDSSGHDWLSAGSPSQSSAHSSLSSASSHVPIALDHTSIADRAASATGASDGAVTAATVAVSTGSGAAADGADSEAARRALASMAQLATAWAQVSSRLAPGTSLAPADAVAAAAACMPPPHSAPNAADRYDQQSSCARPYGAAPAEQQQPQASTSGRGGNGHDVEGGSGVGGDGRDAWGQRLSLPPPPSGGVVAAPTHMALADGYPASTGTGPPQHLTPYSTASHHQDPHPHHHNHNHSQQSFNSHQQQHSNQRQQQHFEAIITALKLALSALQPAPPRPDGRSPATRAVQLASSLADLVAAGLPLDADSLCAGVVAEAAALGLLSAGRIEAALGRGVAALVHDVLRVRQAPSRIELLDDEGAGAVREWCLAFHDVRSCVVEVVSCWDELQHMAGLPPWEQQALALEALQVSAPLGHALGLGPLSAMMEDTCLKVLFPDAYAATSSWLRSLTAPAEESLFAAQQALLSALEGHPEFGRLAGGLVVKARTKSLFSVMKKLLHLGDMAKGGRRREELYDLLGMRAIVQPAEFLPPGEAEAAATRACYIVQEVACRLWRPLSGRSKDYIVAPKPNGYQSIHLTLQLGQLEASYDDHDEYDEVHDSDRGGGADGTAMAAAQGGDGGGAMTDFSCSSSDDERGGAGGRGGGGAPSAAAAAAAWADQVRAAANAAAAGRVGGGDGAAASRPVSTPHSAAASWGYSSYSSYDSTSSSSAAATSAGGASGGGYDGDSEPVGPLCLELQIRTAAMDRAAESGDASHAVYKGGLDARTARQLQAWTQELRSRLAAQPRGRLLLRASAGPPRQVSAEEAAALAERRRRRRERRAALTAATTAHAAAALTAKGTAAATAHAAAAAAPAAPAVEARAGDPTEAAAASSSTPHVFTSHSPAPPPSVHPASPHLLPPPSRRPHAAATGASPSRHGHGCSAPTHGSRSIGSNADPPSAIAAADTNTDASSSSQPVRSTLPRSPVRRPGVCGSMVLAPQPQDEGATLYDSPASPDAAAVSAAAGPERHSRDTPPEPPPEQPQAAAGFVASPPAAESEEQQLHPHGQQPRFSLPPLAQQQKQQRDQLQTRDHVPPQAPSVKPRAAGSLPSASSLSSFAPPSSPPSSPPASPPSSPPSTPPPPLIILSSLEGSVDECEEGGPLLIGLPRVDAEAAAQQLFRALDANGDGRLSLGEVRQALADLASPAAERDAAALVAALDANGDGGVSCDEFVAGLRRAAAEQQQQQQQQL